jgi:stress response protein YsnF
MNKKLTTQEIEKLEKLKSNFDNLVQQIGNIEIQIMNLQLQKEELKMNLQEIKLEEINLGKELEDKYGNGTISLETGEFSPTN